MLRDPDTIAHVFAQWDPEGECKRGRAAAQAYRREIVAVVDELPRVIEQERDKGALDEDGDPDVLEVASMLARIMTAHRRRSWILGPIRDPARPLSPYRIRECLEPASTIVGCSRVEGI